MDRAKGGGPGRQAAAGGRGRLRIIGGRDRGRLLPIPDQPGLRPTADRVRETLFNWLAPVLPGARCLDLFAGSGALGLEAASRGAGRVLLVEHNPVVVRQLTANRATLKADAVEVVAAEALAWLDGTPEPFDIVFLDPPFDAGLLAPACARLAARGWLAPGARVYLESPAALAFPPLPHGWTLLRERTAGAVHFGLALAGHPAHDPSDPPPPM